LQNNEDIDPKEENVCERKHQKRIKWTLGRSFPFDWATKYPFIESIMKDDGSEPN